MISKKWLSLVVLGAFAVSGGAVLADGHGRGGEHEDRGDHGKHDRGRGHWLDKRRDHNDDEDRSGYGFDRHDRDQVRAWYAVHYRHLPPGLAKRYWLPPRLESQLVIRAVLPLDLERRAYPVPVTLERELPPPPPDCERLVVGGHIVLMNRHTRIVLDIFHFN